MTTWRLRLVSPRSGESDVLLTADGSSTGDDVSAALAAMGVVALPLTVDGAAVDGHRSLDDIGLVHGSSIGAGPSAVSPAPRRPGTYLVAVSGPEAGRWVALPRPGRVVIGRATDGEFVLNDALVSGRHAQISSALDGTVTIEDCGSSNGTFLENRRLVGQTIMLPGQYAQVGATVVTLMRVLPSDLPPLAPPESGSSAFQRHFRPALPPLPAHLSKPQAPREEPPDKGRLWLQLVLPFASAAGIVIYSGRWIFLLIALLGPLAMLAAQLHRRRKEGRRKAEEKRRYDAELVEHERALGMAYATELTRRRSTAVVGGEAIVSALLATGRLWERDPGDPDYLQVCIGLAAQPSTVRADKDAEPAVLWGIPLEVSVAQTGSLLVAGEQRRARAVGRSIVLNLAATHSPRDVTISVMTAEDAAADWNWARWLPHTFAGSGASRIYVTDQQRDAEMSRLVQQLETWEGPPPSNAHVVIFDGAHQVDGSWLTTVLRRGPAAGVFGVVLDERYTPEGVRGTLRLGAQPDEGVFTSATRAETVGVLTAELAPSWAEAAALAMAGLQPASRDNAGTTAAEVRLLDLVTREPLTPGTVRDRWSHSPAESVQVGLAGQSPIAIDFVRHGPHGIVGGATRSGKTEFLLTWLTSLCLSNSPDDLAILVADFKGGVDHVQTAKLPHVISLSTNKDIRAFERTLIMLESEIKRREEVFRNAGTSNIEAYRFKRSRDGSLPPVPRLLVVVDEFSELRQTDREGGGGYMGRLESVARVGAGIGIHLVLVTQNFADGQLPAQIESQIGFGVCFRVEEGAHSKVVLRSPVAATIPASRPGRGWARLRGFDLVEFQSARVAGRRRDLVDAGNQVRIDHVPFTSICAASPEVASGAVPHDETDLVLFLNAINAAAAGYARAIPWPRELEESLTLATVLAEAKATRTDAAAIGIEDRPESQAQGFCLLQDRDSQVLVTGSDARNVGDTLLTMVAAQVLTHGPGDLHLYGIDLESNVLQSLAALPHTGAVACLNDDAAIRIIERLRAEVERRRVLFDEVGVADLTGYHRVSGERLPRVRLYVNGADRLAPSGGMEASIVLRPLSALVADAGDTGVDITMGGGASVVGRAITQRVDRRFVLGLADQGLYRSLGVPRSADVDLAVPLRAFDVASGHVVQFGAVASPPHSATEVVTALGAELGRGLPGPIPGGPEPMPEVHWPLLWSRLNPDSLLVPRGYGVSLPLCIDVTTGRWHWLEVDEDGPVVAVGGPARSGRSSALLAIGELARGLGWDVQAFAMGRRSPLRRGSVAPVEDLAALNPATSRRTVYLVDDIHRLDSAEPIGKLIEASTRPIAVLISGPEGVLSSRMGVMRPVPEPRSAITLASTSTSAIGGARIPEHLRADPKPGRGVLWLAGGLSSVQLPLHPSARSS